MKDLKIIGILILDRIKEAKKNSESVIGIQPSDQGKAGIS